MALGVIGHMHQQSAYGRGHTLASYVSRLVEVSGVESANTFGAGFEAVRQLLKGLTSGDVRAAFRFHSLELFFRKLASFSVSEKPVDAARNVAKMECDGR
jgi:hypothetical protein